MQEINTIDQVIAELEEIIDYCIQNNDALGFFAVLYHKVTVKVKEGIQAGDFDDNDRMEHLDVVFAKRYLDAYHAYRNGQPTTHAWAKAFQLSTKYWPIVLQHLLIGINAHINLDLGIAVAEIMKGKDINQIHGDFNKINQILADLVEDVEKDLSAIWPTLKTLLKWTSDVDDFMINFSMKLARDGAWRYAVRLSKAPNSDWDPQIEARDLKVARNAEIVSHPGFIISFFLKFVRLGEKGTIAQKIEKMSN